METINKCLQNLENDIIEIVLSHSLFIAQKETLEIAANECIFPFLQDGSTTLRPPYPLGHPLGPLDLPFPSAQLSLVFIPEGFGNTFGIQTVNSGLMSSQNYSLCLGYPSESKGVPYSQGRMKSFIQQTLNCSIKRKNTTKYSLLRHAGMK